MHLFPFFMFSILAAVVCSMISVLVYFTTPKSTYYEKVSAYECGFEPFGDASSPFEVHYYSVAIMFLIFDVEVGFLFPWAVMAGSMGEISHWTVLVFLAILTAGYYYESEEKVLDWR